jgi:hypothetical protein
VVVRRGARPATGAGDLTALAINDVHGTLQTPPGNQTPPGKLAIRDPANPAAPLSGVAGGSEILATALKQGRVVNPDPSSSRPAELGARRRLFRF